MPGSGPPAQPASQDASRRPRLPSTESVARSQAGSICPRDRDTGAARRLRRRHERSTSCPRHAGVSRFGCTSTPFRHRDVRPETGRSGRTRSKTPRPNQYSRDVIAWEGVPVACSHARTGLTLCSASRIAERLGESLWYLLTNLPAQALLQEEGAEKRHAELEPENCPKV